MKNLIAILPIFLFASNFANASSRVEQLTPIFRYIDNTCLAQGLNSRFCGCMSMSVVAQISLADVVVFETLEKNGLPTDKTKFILALNSAIIGCSKSINPKQ
jgi:hypothetical protein